MASISPSPPPGSDAGPSVKRHSQNPMDKQRAQLEKLLKDPTKPAYVPPPPKEKTIRAAREMMKNVQGSSAGAGSGEFHVYKASRRREYERLKIMDEKTQKEAAEREFEEKRKQWEEEAEAKTAKNRAKRQKKKEKAKAAAKASGDAVQYQPSSAGGSDGPTRSVLDSASSLPIKKRRLVNGREMVFRRPDEEDIGPDGGADDVSEEEPGLTQDFAGAQADRSATSPDVGALPVREISEPRIVIHEDD